NDLGVDQLYKAILAKLREETSFKIVAPAEVPDGRPDKSHIIPPSRIRYLSEIAETNRKYSQWVDRQKEIAQQLFGIHKTMDAIRNLESSITTPLLEGLQAVYQQIEQQLDPENKDRLTKWPEVVSAYSQDFYAFKVRDKEIKVKTFTETLSHSLIPKISLPNYESWGDVLKWMLTENVPGQFPFTSGVFPFKREGEDPTRMFAGEGGPERTNKRFHYVSRNM